MLSKPSSPIDIVAAGLVLYGQWVDFSSSITTICYPKYQHMDMFSRSFLATSYCYCHRDGFKPKHTVLNGFIVEETRSRTHTFNKGGTVSGECSL